MQASKLKIYPRLCREMGFFTLLLYVPNVIPVFFYHFRYIQGKNCFVKGL